MIYWFISTISSTVTDYWSLLGAEVAIDTNQNSSHNVRNLHYQLLILETEMRGIFF